MGKDVTLSKKHGLNPSMIICPICGKEESVAILGYIKGDKEAPRYIQGDICDECKARVADNKCFVISVGENQRLKRYTIVSKDIFTQKVEGYAVLMKEADFNAVFDNIEIWNMFMCLIIVHLQYIILLLRMMKILKKL